MARTYYPMAVRLADGLHKRLTRYQARLSQDITSDQLTALLGLIECLGTFLLKWPKKPLDD